MRRPNRKPSVFDEEETYINFGDNESIYFGDGNDARLYWNGTNLILALTSGGISTTSVISASAFTTTGYFSSSQSVGTALQLNANVVRVDTTKDELKFGLSADTGRAFILTEVGNIEKDHDHATTTHPTLFIHSATNPDTDNAQYVSLYHDGSYGYITSGSGVMRIIQQQFIHDGSYGGVGLLFRGTHLWFCPTLGVNSYPSKLSVEATNGFKLLLDATNNQGNHNLVIGSASAGTTAYAHALNTNPTLFIHSATASATSTAQWISFSHNQTDGVISSGAGAIQLRGYTGKTLSYTAEDTDSDNTDVLITTLSAGYGLLIVRESTAGKTCLLRMENETLAIVSSDGATFSIAKDNAGTINIYFEGNVLKIQNNVGDDKNIRVGFYGI